MSILDHHAKNLMPGVWDQDGVHPTGRFLFLLLEQVRQFANVTRVLLIGDSVSHYWFSDSDVDVVLLVPVDEMKNALPKLAHVGNSVTLDDHIIKFFVFPDTNRVQDLAERFGPIYCIDTVSWHGVVAHDTGELLRPSGLVRRISWLLHKTLGSDDLDVPDWKIEFAAFDDMKAISRNDTLSELNRRIILADHALEAFLPTLSRGEWKLAAEFESKLNEKGQLPSVKANAKAKSMILDVFRRRELYEALQERHDNLENLERVDAQERGAAVQKTALTIDFMPGDWFKTKLELFPLLQIKNIHRDVDKMAIGSENYDDDVRLVDFEFVGADGVPTLATATLKEVKGYGLTEAKDKDFEDLGFDRPTPMV